MKASKSTYIIMILIFILCIQILGIYSKHKIAAFNSSVTSKKGVTNELIIALFIEDITLVMDSYYKNYFSDGIGVFNYDVSIKNIHKGNNAIIITFAVPAEIGAHVSVSDDEITYSVDSSGFVSLVSFKHIKIYKLPEHLKNYETKPLPEIKRINNLRKEEDHAVIILFF